MEVAGKAVCQRCVTAIRARVAGEMGASPQPGAMPSPQPVASQSPYGYSSGTVPPGGYPPPASDTSGVAYQPYGAATPAPPAPAGMSIGNVFGGIGLGLLAAIGGTIAWVALVWAVHFNLSLLAIGVGFLIGVAVVKGTGGRGGAVAATISALIALVFLAVGALLTSSAIFGIFCVAVGVYQAYRTPMNYG